MVNQSELDRMYISKTNENSLLGPHNMGPVLPGKVMARIQIVKILYALLYTLQNQQISTTPVLYLLRVVNHHLN